MLRRNRTYGIEIECVSNVDRYSLTHKINEVLLGTGHECTCSGYIHNTDQNNVNLWYVKTDMSVTTNQNNRMSGHVHGCEVVSPILVDDNGLTILDKVLTVVDRHCKVNKSTGLHVHHMVKRSEDNKLYRVFNDFKESEKHFFKIVSPSRQNNTYCMKWSRLGLFGVRMNESNTIRDMRRSLGNNRYRSLNFESLEDRPTIEFRFHNGSTEFIKIKNFIRLTQEFVYRSLHNKMVSNNNTLDWVSQFLVSPIERVVNVDTNNSSTTFSDKYFHPESKKRKKPRNNTKLRVIFDMLFTGTNTKEMIENELIRRFGYPTGRYNYQQIVEHKISDFRSLKYGFGLQIRIENGYYKVYPYHTIEQVTETVNETDYNFENVVNWFINRYHHFNYDNNRPTETETNQRRFTTRQEVLDVLRMASNG